MAPINSDCTKCTRSESQPTFEPGAGFGKKPYVCGSYLQLLSALCNTVEVDLWWCEDYVAVRARTHRNQVSTGCKQKPLSRKTSLSQQTGWLKVVEPHLQQCFSDLTPIAQQLVQQHKQFVQYNCTAADAAM